MGAYVRWEICVSKSIGLALELGGDLPFLLCFALYLRTISKYKPPGSLYLEGLIFGILRYIKLTYGMNNSFQRARTTTTVSIKLTAVLILSVQLKTFVTSVYNDPYIFHKTIYFTNRKHGVHLTWRDCLGKYSFGWLLFKLENKQESDSTQSHMNNLLYFNSLCTDVPPPSRKIGRGDVHIFGS